MSASVNKELRAVRKLILKAAVNGDLTISDLEERKIENQHLMLGIPYLETLILNHTAALKQELKQSLEATPACPRCPDCNMPHDHIAWKDFRKAITAVFQDKGDNRE